MFGYILKGELKMAKYITASEAARRLGVTDKTVRLWLEKGTYGLQAHHSAKNRLAILETDIERIKRERDLYQDEKQDTTDIIGRIKDLEAKYAALEEKCTELEKRMDERVTELPVPTFATSAIDQIPRAQKRIVERNRDVSPDKELPPGCILARDFARMHGVAPETFRDHFMKGLGRGLEVKDKVEVSDRPKPGRSKETEYYLTPEQQQAALDFWRRYDIPFKKPDQTEE